jgi:hypothetical protein
MKYVAFVGTEGAMPDEAVAEMNRDFPAYFEEMGPRGVRLYGRELDFPEKAMTVRVREGETLVSDGPFAETKEFVGGFAVLDCADLDEAIEVESKSPVARFLPLEIRPFRGGLRLGPAAPAFDREEDSAGLPYLFTVWASGSPAVPLDDKAVAREYDAWQHELEASGTFVFGNALAGPGSATTLRPRDGVVQVSDGPFLDSEDFIAGIDVVVCADGQRAISLAAAHPMARHHAVEVRPFYSEAIHAERLDDPTE